MEAQHEKQRIRKKKKKKESVKTQTQTSAVLLHNFKMFIQVQFHVDQIELPITKK